MTEVVLLILALIWAAVLIPPLLQSRRQGRPGDSIASFRRQLTVLQRATPGSYTAHFPAAHSARRGAEPSRAGASAGALGRRSPAAMGRAEARRRRREVFFTLLGATALTFVLAAVIGGPVWGLHGAVVLLLAGYVGMLVKLQQQARERDAKLRYLPPALGPSRPEPALALRRSALARQA